MELSFNSISMIMKLGSAPLYMCSEKLFETFAGFSTLIFLSGKKKSQHTNFYNTDVRE